MRRLLRGGASMDAVAEQFGVSKRTAYRYVSDGTPMTAALPAAEPFAPLCMDADELADWHALNSRNSNRSERAATPCDDCLLGFAAEMRAQGRCNGTPGGDEEEEVRNYSDESRQRMREGAKRRWERQRAAKPADADLELIREREGDAEREVVAEWTRTSSSQRNMAPLEAGDGKVLEELASAWMGAPALPCDGCLHAEVCRFRHLVAEPDGPLALVREVHPGIRLRAVRVEVECDHRLAAIPA